MYEAIVALHWQCLLSSWRHIFYMEGYMGQYFSTRRSIALLLNTYHVTSTLSLLLNTVIITTR